ncbi:hypothetical protein M096_3847 [Parabacteroides distasonis str. 3999B T(B) 6]|nr:hypothetical protein M096_3847 [Parabacteroides distasonis str. 3999B T(B) 6]KDS68995.1 hypothetical protein M095_1814 [Parabacteroides distasonis str. 3999B T(B) 4]
MTSSCRSLFIFTKAKIEAQIASLCRQITDVMTSITGFVESARKPVNTHNP